MLPRIAYISNEAADGDRRRAGRRTVFLPASPSAAPWGSRAILLDLSETGFRLQCHSLPRVGETIEIDLPLAGRVAARIVWQDENECGASFDVPVTRAAVSAAILASPHRAGEAQQPSAQRTPRSQAEQAPRPPLDAKWALLALLPSVLLLLYALAHLPISGW